MSLEAWSGFVITSLIVLVIPGPTVLMVTSYSIAYGRRVNPFHGTAHVMLVSGAVARLVGFTGFSPQMGSWSGALRVALAAMSPVHG